MMTFGDKVQRGLFSRPSIVGAIILIAVIACSVAVRANNDRLQGIAARLGSPEKTPVAFAFIAGRFTRLDSRTGAILAQSPDFSRDQFPSMAVSHDGQSLFVLHSELLDGEYQDQLLTLSTTSLTPQASAPVQHFMRSMESWPPALAVTPDDNTVLVSQYGNNDSDPYWLSYYDRQTGRFAVDSTILGGCGVSQLLPFDEQVAVLCLGSDDVRFVNLRSHRVTATIKPWTGGLGNPVTAGVIPGQAAFAIVLNHGSLVRADLASQTVSLIASLVPPDSELEPFAVAFSTNGRVAVLLDLKSGVRPGPHPVRLLIADISDGHILDQMSVDVEYGGYDALTIAPDGQRVWVTGEHHVLNEVDLTTHRVRPFGPDPANTWVHLVIADR